MKTSFRWWAILMAGAVLPGCTEPAGEEWSIPGPPGALLLSEPYSELEVRVHYVGDRKPDPAAVETLNATLHEILRKNDIRIITDAAPTPPFPEPYNPHDILQVASERFSLEFPLIPPVHVIHVVYANGGPADHPQYAAWYAEYQGAPIIFMLKDRWSNALGLIDAFPGHEQVERALLVHEFGHAMGLVNRGIPMITPREDPENHGHSTNRQSVMYSGVNNLAGLGEFVADNMLVPYKFDSDDIADLRAFQSAHR